MIQLLKQINVSPLFGLAVSEDTGYNFGILCMPKHVNTIMTSSSKKKQSHSNSGK